MEKFCEMGEAGRNTKGWESDEMSVWHHRVSVREIKNLLKISQVYLRDWDTTLTSQSRYCFSSYLLLIYHFWVYSSLKLSSKQILEISLDEYFRDKWSYTYNHKRSLGSVRDCFTFTGDSLLYRCCGWKRISWSEPGPYTAIAVSVKKLFPAKHSLSLEVLFACHQSPFNL